MTDSRDLFLAHQGSLEDFWRRRSSTARFHRTVRIFGHALTVDSNHAQVLDAVDIAARSYSVADPSDRSFRMQIVVDDQWASGIDPSGHLPESIKYVGSGDWLSMGIGLWGQVHMDLTAGTATAVLSPELAADPQLTARWVIHTIWTNFLIRSGCGMMHATALHRNGTLLCFVAPHNSGKSTTAVRLTLHGGFRLLSDSLLFVDGPSDALRFNAFPVGRVSLRADTLAGLPELAPMARAETIRSEAKYDIDLSRFAPEKVQETAVLPGRVLLFILARHGEPETALSSAQPDEVRRVLMANSMFYDTGEVWSANLDRLDALLETAEPARLVVGTDTQQMLDVVDQAVRGGS